MGLLACFGRLGASETSIGAGGAGATPAMQATASPTQQHARTVTCIGFGSTITASRDESPSDDEDPEHHEQQQCWVAMQRHMSEDESELEGARKRSAPHAQVRSRLPAPAAHQPASRSSGFAQMLDLLKMRSGANRQQHSSGANAQAQRPPSSGGYYPHSGSMGSSLLPSMGSSLSLPGTGGGGSKKTRDVSSGSLLPSMGSSLGSRVQHGGHAARTPSVLGAERLSAAQLMMRTMEAERRRIQLTLVSKDTKRSKSYLHPGAAAPPPALNDGDGATGARTSQPLPLARSDTSPQPLPPHAHLAVRTHSNGHLRPPGTRPPGTRAMSASTAQLTLQFDTDTGGCGAGGHRQPGARALSSVCTVQSDVTPQLHGGAAGTGAGGQPRVPHNQGLGALLSLYGAE